MARKRKEETRASLLLPCATTGWSLLAVRGLSGAMPRGQPWTPAVSLPQGRNGLSARRLAVVCPFRAPSLWCHVHRAYMRNTWRDLKPMRPTTACHQRHDIETSRRSTTAMMQPLHGEQFALNGVVGLVSQGAGRGPLRVCKDGIPPRLLVLKPAPHPYAVGCPCGGDDVVGPGASPLAQHIPTLHPIIRWHGALPSQDTRWPHARSSAPVARRAARATSSLQGYPRPMAVGLARISPQ